MITPGYLLDPSPSWFPYFGNQRRFVPYVLELLHGLGARKGDTFFETNAGSHAISWHANKHLGLRTIANDLGYYSVSIGKALKDPSDREAVSIASRGAALMNKYGYNPPENASVTEGDTERWAALIEEEHDSNPNSSLTEVTRGNLFDEIKQQEGRFVYCDFAWPWRDGSSTEEYTTTADTFGALLGDTADVTFEMANGRRILDDVIEYLDLALSRFEYVILSNQSSNYPTPEVLEPHIRACGFTPVICRRLTVPAEYVDDLGKDPFFTEYQYVFEGRRG